MTLRPATPEEVRSSIAYALSFDERGKALTKGLRENSDYMAERITAHLARSLYVVMKKAPEPVQQSPFGHNNPGAPEPRTQKSRQTEPPAPPAG